MGFSSKREKNRLKAIVLAVFVVVIIVVGIGVALVLVLLNKNNKEGYHNKFTNRGLPIIDITLNDVELEEIKSGSKDIKYKNNNLSIYNGNKELRYGGIEIKGRGNTAWFCDKKSFQIKFPQKTNLLGMNEAKKWVFLPNYVDATSIRNDVAFLFAEMVGEKYSSRGEFVELYFNGEYEGLYYVMHKIEIGKNLVDIRGMDGILFEMDDLHGMEEEYYESYFGNKLVLKDIVLDEGEYKNKIINRFMDDYKRFEKALEDEDYTTVSEIVDIESFVKYYLINEFAVNPDAYTSSFYLYRNDDGKISAGPVWDFDYALGNREWVWQSDDSFFSPNEKEKNLSLKMMKYLVKMPGFYEKVAELFNDKMKGNKEHFLSIINNEARRILEAVNENNKKWGKNDFGVEFKKLTEWIDMRYDYFEKEYGLIRHEA